jgi:hypothetical protein
LNAGLGFWETHNRRHDPKDGRLKLEEGEDKISLPPPSKDVIKKLSALPATTS